MTGSFVIPAEFISHFNRKDCILVIGDDLGKDISFSRELTQLLIGAGALYQICSDPACAQQERCCEPELCPFTLAQTSQWYESQNGPQALIDFVCRQADTIKTDPIFEMIAALPVQIIVTTMLDDRLEMAFQKTGKAYQSVIGDPNVPFSDSDQVQVIHLRGILSQPSSIAITEEHSRDFFARFPIISTTLQAHFATKTLLFIGFHLGDPVLMDLYAQITHPIDRFSRLAYAVDWLLNPLHCDLWRKKIEAIQAEPVSFLRQLLRIIQEEPKEVKQPNLPSEPYKFLDFFTANDKGVFFGRAIESDLLSDFILAHKLTVFYGRSGTGKTSLLLASVAPTLEENDYSVAYARMLGDPVIEVKDALLDISSGSLPHQIQGQSLVEVIRQILHSGSRLVIILDQFEEFFLRQGEAVRKAFAQELAACLWPSDPNLSRIDIRLVLSLRDDYLGNLDEIARFFPQDIFSRRYKLENLTREKALLAAVKPAEAFGLSIEDALLYRLIDDLEDRGLEAPNLQIVLYYLYRDAVEQGLWIPEKRFGKGLTLDRYLVLGKTGTILNNYLDQVLDELPDQKLHDLGKVILKNMVTAEKTKSTITHKEISNSALIQRTGAENDKVDFILQHLRESRVVRKFGDEDSYELAHEVMVAKVWEWYSDKERQALNLDEMLKRAATDYRKFGLLLPLDHLNLAFEHAEDILPDVTTLELLLLSSIEQDLDPAPWVARMDGAQAVSILAGCLKTQRKTRLPVIAKALGQTDSPEAVPCLNELLYDVDNPTQRAAVAALSLIGSFPAIRSLYQAGLQEDKLARVAPIIDALEQMRSEPAICGIISIAAHNKNIHIQNRAYKSLDRFGYQEMVGLIIQQFVAENLDLPLLLGPLKRLIQSNPNEVANILQNQEKTIRLQIITALEQTDDADAAIPLAIMVSDPDTEISTRALAALQNNFQYTVPKDILSTDNSVPSESDAS